MLSPSRKVHNIHPRVGINREVNSETKIKGCLNLVAKHANFSCFLPVCLRQNMLQPPMAASDKISVLGHQTWLRHLKERNKSSETPISHLALRSNMKDTTGI